MTEITMEITVKGLSPDDAQALAEFVAARLINKHSAPPVVDPVQVQASTGIVGMRIEDRQHPNSQAMVDKMYPLHTVPGYVDPTPAPVTVGNAPVTAPSVEPIISPTPVTASSGERDSKGVIWDTRFHTSTKRQNANGTWSKVKGCDDVALAAHVLACKAEPAAVTEPQKIMTSFDMPVIPTPATEPQKIATSFDMPVIPTPAPVIPTPGPVAVQTPYGELIKLWTDLCVANAVTPQLAAWMETQGGNPMDSDIQGGNIYSRNPMHCRTVIDVLTPFKR